MAKATKKTTVLRISAKRDGFRRAGIAHTSVSTDHPLDRFTKEQVALLKAEPMLMVSEEEIDVAVEDGAAGGSAAA